MAGVAGQRWPELAEQGGGRLAKHLLPTPCLGLMLLVLCVREGLFHSSVREKKGMGCCACCGKEAGTALRARQRPSHASASPSGGGLPTCLRCKLSQLWGTADRRLHVRALMGSHFGGWGRSGCVKVENIYRF